MKKRIVNFTSLIVVILFLVGFGYLGYLFEVWRWHTFQEVTHSDISFWKWFFLFGKR